MEDLFKQTNLDTVDKCICIYIQQLHKQISIVRIFNTKRLH